jgi:hypothetical protein
MSGVFSSRDEAQRALTALGSIGVPDTKTSLLTPGDMSQQVEWVRFDAAESAGAGRGQPGLTSAFLPGVGRVTGAGALAIAILRAAGARIDAAAGESPKDALVEALPEDEIFLYEDALRDGRSVVIALAEDSIAAEPIRESLVKQGGEASDARRQQWWMGLRDNEREHYSASGRNFTQDEKFYRLGFEAALHARTRCMEFDQVSAEMDSRLEDLERQYPEADIEEPFTRGYRRGREYFQALCDERAA